WLKVDVLPGLFRWVVLFFKQAMEGLDRVIYTVDEWLRFRPGDSRLSLYLKPALGLVWFLLTYVIRLVINLFVEPTVNPIKHFPVVTGRAKLLLPGSLPLRTVAHTLLDPLMSRVTAEFLYNTAFVLIPGLAGFIAWELKENWKLYAANRSPVLRPVMIGHHG